jgi:hypothetical protein
MALTCPKCRRRNPAEATYCYFDGMVLTNGHAAAGPVNPATAAFPMPFVFPSGQACHNFDQLALACLNNWTTARDLVGQGILKGFFGGLGRADLALAAEEAARYPDKDRGLAQLLGKLPTHAVPTPKLAVKPVRIDLGTLRVGQDKPLELRLSNEGLGLLYGTVQCDDSPWLALLNVPVGTNRKLFQFVDEAVIPMLVPGHSLRAGNKPLEAKLTVESNGGTQEVVVTAQVPVKPFPTGVLAGAVTPRKIAEKAKAAPKEAAVYFENGAVQQWYKDNGWTYPVQGPSASGLAAVQQFFEALGLTPPPKVRLSVNSLSLESYAGGALRSSLEVTTPEKRPIYAHAVSDQPWLKVGRPQAKGRTVTIPLAVPTVPHCPGEVLLAKLTVTSNGNQRFEVPVTLAVAGSAAAAGAVPVLDMMEVVSAPGPTAARGAWNAPDAVEAVMAVPVLAPAAAVAVAQPAPASYQTTAPPMALPAARPVAAPPRLLPWVPVAFLLLGLMVTSGRDFVKWWQGPNTIGGGGGGGNELIDTVPRITLNFHDEEMPITLGEGGIKPLAGRGAVESNGFWEPSMRFGLVKNDDGLKQSGIKKKLTFMEDGTTNNAVVRIDRAGDGFLFGERPFRREDGKRTFWGYWPPGHWRDKKVPLGKDKTGRERLGYKSVWSFDDQHIEVTQTVEIVPGPQSNLLDTCLVRYHIKNEDTRTHKVGLRFLLDTYIGANDGVPFLIPGERELCDTMKEFPTPESVPDFIQACENQDLTNPGTIARIGLKVGGELEAPSRVTLGAWPNLLLSRINDRCHQEKTLWSVPVLPIRALQKIDPDAPPDSAVVIYWEEKDLAPDKTRDVGFTYGLGDVSGGEGKGRLALTAGGSFAPGGAFTVTAYVSNPTPGQTVTLTLPDSFEFISGAATQPVPPVPADAASRNSPVTWKVRASQRTGDATLKARTSSGDAQTLPVHIKVQGIFGN